MELDLSSYPYLLHPCPAVLVSCGRGDGESNLIAIAWITPVSVKPPRLAFSMRPTRHSYGLIAQGKEFAVNLMSRAHAGEVLFCGRRSGRDHDKWAEARLTATPARVVRCPLVAEAVAHIECRVFDTYELGDHVLVVGEVVAADVSDEVWTGRTLDLTRYRPLLHVGANLFATTVAETVEPPLPA
jgi:flavin reductase (DIM6/NTAB) family NADH-FMN oxidoreductase RutF